MKQILILFVRAYQIILSPLFYGCCRFEPSCSNYAIEALKVHGALNIVGASLIYQSMKATRQHLSDALV